MAHPNQRPATDGKHNLKKLMQTASGAVLELDPAGNILFASRAAEELFGYQRGELAGQTLEALIPDLYSSTPEGDAFRVEALRKDGWYFPVELSINAVKSPPGLHIVAVIREATERKQMESRIHAMEREIADLEMRAREVENCLGNVRHDLRSPLCTVIGFAELLSEETDPALSAKQRRFISYIHKDSLHLLDLINDSLEFKKDESSAQAASGS